MTLRSPVLVGLRSLRSVVLIAMILVGGCSLRTAPPENTLSAPRLGSESESRAVRKVTIVAINDVYRLAAVDGGTHGGMARLRALRAELEQDAPELLLLHAGDFLSPSLLSRTFLGAQMIDVLNLLDGDAEGFDERMFVTFGNHEFDLGKLRHTPELNRRLRESDFRWVSTNIDFLPAANGKPLVAGPNLVDLWITESSGVKVGIFGLTIDSQAAEYIDGYRDPLTTARNAVAELRRRGAELVIGLTHLNATQDVRLLEELREEGPDLVVGGHEHDRLERCVGGNLVEDGLWHRCQGGRSVVKADADARTVAIWEIEMAEGEPPEVRYRWQPLGPKAPTPDPTVTDVVADWNRRFDEIYCSALEPPEAAGCLEEQVGITRTPLFAEELEIRRFETNLGNWLAGQSLAAWRSMAADDPSIPVPHLAILNSGSIRLNQTVPVGPVTRRTIEELFPFPAKQALFRATGTQLQQIVNHSISRWEGNGHFLQIAGFAYHHHVDSGTADGLTYMGPNGPRTIRPDDEFVVAAPEFLLDDDGNQDGYTMIRPEDLIRTHARVDLREQVIKALRDAGAEGIGPEVDGRVCTFGGTARSDSPHASQCLAIEAGPIQTE